jgi:hypothetical protein
VCALAFASLAGLGCVAFAWLFVRGLRARAACGLVFAGVGSALLALIVWNSIDAGFAHRHAVAMQGIVDYRHIRDLDTNIDQAPTELTLPAQNESQTPFYYFVCPDSGTYGPNRWFLYGRFSSIFVEQRVVIYPLAAPTEAGWGRAGIDFESQISKWLEHGI